MPAVLSEQLATRVRATLRQADHPATAAGTAAAWRVQRDRWLDALDPRHGAGFTGGEIQRLIDFLAESGPSAASRITADEWRATLDGLTPELLFSGR